MELNKFFNEIYLINLDRRIDRRLSTLYQFDRIGLQVTLFSAIDGTQLKTGTEIQNRSENRSYSNVNPGELGYLKSWQEILQAAVKADHDRIMIFDDDVLFNRDYVALWERFRSGLPDNWFIIYLGASQHATIDWEKAEKDARYNPARTDGSFAVGLSKDAIKTVLSRLQSRFVDGCLDSCILRKIFENADYTSRSFVAVPNIVVADVSNSDLRGPRDQKEMAARFHWRMENYLSTTTPVVSVIVAVYNAERSLWTSLMSLYNQTYPALEIVIIDDCSEDGSWNIVQELKKFVDESSGSSRTVIIERHKINKGCYIARNRGLKLATGQIIAFQDADDVSLCYRIEEQVVALWHKRVLWTQCLILRTHLESIDLDKPEEIDEARVHRKKTGDYRFCCAGVLGMITGVFRRSVFDTIGFFKEYRCCADAEFCERVLAHYAGVRFTGDDQSVGNYLTNIRIPGVYYKINRIMYLCHQMRPSNLTRKYNSEYRLSLQKQWRK